jgi:cytochrome c oxidase assembly protein subunit 15
LILGTQVREEIDHIAQKIAGRELWIEMLSWKFYVHRSLSLLILGVALWIYKMSKFLQNPSLLLWSRHHLVLILCAVIAGVVLAYLNMPAIVQPLHLLIGVSVCCVLVYLGRMLYAPMKEQE